MRAGFRVILNTSTFSFRSLMAAAIAAKAVTSISGSLNSIALL